MKNYSNILNFLSILNDSKMSKEDDDYTSKKCKITAEKLIDKAGYFISDSACRLLNNKISRILIICGSGGNGADGWIAAKYLLENGFFVTVFSLNKIRLLNFNAKIATLKFINLISKRSSLYKKKSIIIIKDDKQLSNFLLNNNPKLIIDAIFGSGLNRKISKLNDKIIKVINNYRIKNKIKILSVDVPSGIFCNGDNINYRHIVADQTIIFSRLKVAHLIDKSAVSCGEIIYKNIGLVYKNRIKVKYLGFLGKDNPFKLMKKLKNNEHKGSFGHLAILEGESKTIGASRLSALSALRSGCGSVSLILSNNKNNNLISNIIELMYPNFNDINEIFLKKISSLLLGPGLGENNINKNQARFLFNCAVNMNIPVVIDAGAIFLINECVNKNTNIIALPHPGEAANILGLKTKYIQNNRISAMNLLLKLPINKKSKIIWVLKGASPIIGEINKSLIICKGFFPSLSIAGSGDVLAGITSSFLAQGYSLIDSVFFSVNAHLQAGSILQKKSIRGHLSSDIANILPKILFDNCNV